MELIASVVAAFRGVKLGLFGGLPFFMQGNYEVLTYFFLGWLSSYLAITARFFYIIKQGE